MKLNVFGIPFPNGMAMTNRLSLYCKAIQESDSEIDITIYSEGEQESQGEKDGIKYQVLKKSSFLHPTLSYYLRPLLIWRNFLKASKGADVVFITRESMLVIPFIYLISRIRRFKVVQELNENIYLPYGHKYSPLWWAKMKTYICLHTTFKLLDGYICISKPLDELVKKYNKTAKHIIVPILCEDKGYSYNPDFDNPFIFNAGCTSMYKDGFHTVIEGYGRAHLQCCKLKFLQTIYVATEIEDITYRKIIEKYSLDNSFVKLGYIPKEEVNKYQSKTLLAILNKPSNWQNDFNFPTKLGEYLIAGVPVISTRTGALGDYLINGKNAILINENNPVEIENAIMTILNNHQFAYQIGRNGRDLALKHFNYSSYSKILSEFFGNF